MTYTSILSATDQRITTISLNKPERKNALDDVMIHELTEAFQVANRNIQTRIVILEGVGSAFCAGMDLSYLQRYIEKGEVENLEDAKNLSKLLLCINSMKKVVIAKVQGHAMGGGCGLAAACDYVFASSSAKLGVPEVCLGFLPAVILKYLIKRMGEGKARELALRGDILDATTAKDRGLVSEVVEDAQLSSVVNNFALHLASSTSASSVSLTKELFARMDEMDDKESMDYASHLNALTRKTEDFKKGIDSFLKKEKPQW